MAYSIGICAWSLPTPGAHALRLAKELGFDAIQLELGSYDHCLTYTHPRFQKLALTESRDTGVRLLPMTLNALCAHGFVGGLDTAEGRIARYIIEAGVDAAAAMGLEGVAVPNFGVNMITEAAHLDATAEALDLACTLAAQRGLTVYTENVLNAAEMTALFAACPHDNLRLLFDSHNYAALGRGDGLEVLRTHWARTGSYLHVKDGEERFGTLPLGEGRSPLAGLAAWLKEQDYQGAIVLENNYNNPPFAGPGADPLAAVERDVNTLRAMMAR